MASFSRHASFLAMCWGACCTAGAARAASPDPRTLRDQLEDQVLDGDRDAEDLASFRLGRQGPGWRPDGHAYLALQAFVADVPAGRELGALVVLQLPLDRFASPASVPSHSPVDAANARSTGDVIAPAPVFSFPLAPLHEISQSVAGVKPSPPTPVVTTDVARACVRAAWRTLGIADDGRVDSMAARARSSASLPEVRLRAVRTIDESGRLTLTEADPYHYTEAGGATNLLEARLTFRLDRLLFADDEVSLERVRIERSELRSRTTAKVLQTLFEWQRAYALLQDPALSSDDHFAALLREIEASAVLDVMTDGWFGRFRAGLLDHP
jgi:hypothetical protein